jgi:dynein heavy chain 2
MFTERCEDALQRNSLQEFNIEMENQLEAYTNVNIAGSGMNDVDSKVLELKLKALILDTIHNIEVIQLLIQNKIRSPEDWLWQKQLRLVLFYLRL